MSTATPDTSASHQRSALRIAVITCSDTRGIREDTAGAALEDLIRAEGWEVIDRLVVRDERTLISSAIIRAADDLDADIIITCGGSGLSLRDVTPEATRVQSNYYSICDVISRSLHAAGSSSGY